MSCSVDKVKDLGLHLLGLEGEAVWLLKVLITRFVHHEYCHSRLYLMCVVLLYTEVEVSRMDVHLVCGQ